MNWESILQRHDLIGGYILAKEGGALFRGKLNSIQKEGNEIIRFGAINLECLDSETQIWKKFNDGCGLWSVNKKQTLAIIDSCGHILFEIMLIGQITILPLGTPPILMGPF